MGKHPRLISDEMAYAASLRAWGKHDVQRLALAIAWGRYGTADAEAELATTLAWHAEQAGIRTVSCKVLAAAMLDEELNRLEAHYDEVLQRMTQAAVRSLRDDPADRLAAATAAADIARAERVPPRLITTAMRFATWRTKRRG